jgi:hypothetical protein
LEVLSRVLAEVRRMKPGKLDKVNCNLCDNFYITWEAAFPYGCRAMDFKSVRLPSLDVADADGQECLAFQDKVASERERKPANNLSNLKKLGRVKRKLNIEV